MQLRQLTETEICEIYNGELLFDFPADEVKPLKRILRMLHDGIYFAFGLFEGEALCGYAFFVGSGDGKSALLDYFAVLRGKRNGGIGSCFLEMLRRELQALETVVLESEAVDAAEDEASAAVRTRRIAFYLRNGLRRTGIRTVVFGVEYEILCLDCAAHPDDASLRQTLGDIYRRMFCPDFADRFSIL